MKPTHHHKETLEVSCYTTCKHSIDKDVIIMAIGQLRYFSSEKLTKAKIISQIKTNFFSEGYHWIEWYDWKERTATWEETEDQAKTESTKIAKRLFPEFFKLHGE